MMRLQFTHGHGAAPPLGLRFTPVRRTLVAGSKFRCEFHILRDLE